MGGRVIGLSLAQHLVVVGLDDASNVRHTAVTDFYSVPIEDLAQLGLLREVLTNQSQESLSDTCLYILAEWRVEPNHVMPSSFPPRGIFHRPFALLEEGEALKVATCLEGVVIRGSCLVENVPVA